MKKRYAARDPIRNSTILPNEVFQLDLRPTAIAVYAYLLRLENADFRCWPSFEKIAEAVGCSKRTVPKYVSELCEKRLVTVEPTSVMTKDGLKWNGNLLYKVLSIQGTVDANRIIGRILIMAAEKARHTIWLTNEAWEKVKNNYRSDNCSTQNEFVEKAIRFYAGYINAREASAYLPRILAEVLEGKLIVFGDHICKLLFKLAVQEAITANLIAADTDVDLKTMETLTGTCVKQVARVHGALGYEDALRFQKRLD